MPHVQVFAEIFLYEYLLHGKELQMSGDAVVDAAEMMSERAFRDTALMREKVTLKQHVRTRLDTEPSRAHEPDETDAKHETSRPDEDSETSTGAAHLETHQPAQAPPMFAAKPGHWIDLRCVLTISILVLLLSFLLSMAFRSTYVCDDSRK